MRALESSRSAGAPTPRIRRARRGRRAVAAGAGLCLALLCAWPAGPARAQERWLLTLEGDFALPVGEPQSSAFGPGASAAAGLYRPIAPWLLAGARLRGGLLSSGSAPADPSLADPGAGGLATLSLAARLRPLAGDDPRRGVGPFVEVAAGPGLTGELVRAAVELGVGYGLALGPVALAPTLRYLQIVQPQGGLEDRDARLLLAGVEVVLFDAPAPPEPAPQGPGDRDGDGVLDPDDACPDVPEDLDGFEDEDGCPDLDDDRDGIPDTSDACPREPEDPDGFEDEDGCPDLDNDRDGFPDALDSCPNEPETVNGVEDGDGCPDEGLIQMIDDRIVLEDRVLFATDRARVQSRARPLLDAIVELYRQQGDWAQVTIEGHADFRGSDRYNQDLSERRAAAVGRALVSRGLPAEMIRSMGFGSTRPRTLGESDRSLQANRRVEFVVLRRSAVPAAAGAEAGAGAEPPEAAAPPSEGTQSQEGASP